MKKRIVILLVGILLSGGLRAQQTDKENKIVPWERGEQMGTSETIAMENWLGPC